MSPPHPQVCIEAPFAGVRPITARPSGVAAIVGAFSRGPLDRATRIGSAAELATIFGETGADTEAALAARQFFANGGRTAWIVRTRAASRRAGAPSRAADIVGRADAGTGLHALPDAADLLLTPDTARMSAAEAKQVAAAAIDQAARRRMFHVHDIPHGDQIRNTPRAAAAWLRANPKLRHADVATYFPRLLIETPGKRRADHRMPMDTGPRRYDRG